MSYKLQFQKHECKYCLKCFVCHTCLKNRASIFRENDSGEDIHDMFVHSADYHFDDTDPQYIIVGPDNERIVTNRLSLTATKYEKPELCESSDDSIADANSIVGEDNNKIVVTNAVTLSVANCEKPELYESSDDSIVDENRINECAVDENQSNESISNNLQIQISEPISISNLPKQIKKPVSKSNVGKLTKKPVSKSNIRKQIKKPYSFQRRINERISEDDLEQQLSESSDEDEPVSLDCSVCNKTFSNRRDLDIHLIYHSTEEVHKCKVCGMLFEYSYELIKHSLNHKNPNNVCDFCKKEFRTSEKLRVHVASHTGEFPFSCVVCDRGFKDYPRLKSHLLCHTEDKPFVCDKCGKGFRRKSQLNTHSWVHSEVKPFSCQFCGKPFNYKCNLRLHVQRNHMVYDPNSEEI